MDDYEVLIWERHDVDELVDFLNRVLKDHGLRVDYHDLDSDQDCITVSKKLVSTEQVLKDLDF